MAVCGKYNMLCLRCKFLIVVLLTFFHRKCSGQVNFHCTTLQPQPLENFQLGSAEETRHYTVTVDQPYYQQSSTRRVTVDASELEFTSLYLQARIVNGGSIGGWSSPYPAGYSITGCLGQLDSIIKVSTQAEKSAVFEWVFPFPSTTFDITFMATFVNGAKYYIITSETISDPCNPSPCSAGETCFRGTAPPGFFCADACIALTCQNGGNCSVLNGEAKCNCPDGLTGRTCESCDGNYCQNGGNCIVNSGGQLQCLCPPSYTGTRCQFPRGGSPCDSSPCLNGGTCEQSSDGYQCTCRDGFFGIHCENQLNSFCSTAPCRNGGTCEPIGTSGGSCSCAAGFSGPHCEVPNDEFCSLDWCKNGATCLPFSDGVGGFCMCSSGFSGPFCDEPDDFCMQQLCQNNATCVTVSGGIGGQCICPDGFTGPLCEESIPEDRFCSQSPCLNGGECLDLSMGAGQCMCPDEYTGALCEVPVSQGCSPDNCQNGGTCVRVSLTASQCQCVDGYTGSHCELEEIIDFCSFELCRNGATCMNIGTSGTTGECLCADGYTGFQCETQIIEGFCAQGLCQNGATCMETLNGGYCVCASGFSGAACDIVVSGFCAHEFCQNGATCIDSSTGGFCVCAAGFTGPACDVENSACSPNPCFNGGSCSLLEGGQSFQCSCVSGFSGTLCQIFTAVETPCTSTPCQNGGTCTSNPGSTDYSCECASPFVGTNCETDPCIANPCLNGAQCIPIPRELMPICVCPSGFSGSQCENTPCTNNPCRNGGTCTLTQGSPGYSCQCLSSFQGTNCETEIPDRCVPNPCLNLGVCSISTGPAGFQCTCPPHVLGTTCQFSNPCASNPCLQGGTCFPTVDGSSYTCVCPSAFSGVNCQTSAIDACSNSLCVNGTCVEDSTAALNYRCLCQEGFGGDFCDNIIDYCLAIKPCLNGGTCSNDGSSYECDCTRPFFGDECLYNRDNGPVFRDCSDTTHNYAIRPNNTAYVDLNITAMVPETGEVIGFDVIVGPDSVSFPGEVMYTEDYLEGQKFTLRAIDQFSRESTCSFTIRLTDPVAPTVECPGDHEDISSQERVVVASLPLPPIEANDNVGLRTESSLEFSPSEVTVDGVPRLVTVSVYDVDGNKGECQFNLTLHRGDGCQSSLISTDNAHVTCLRNSEGVRVCELMCDEGFAPPNGNLYTCANANWNEVPLPCLAIQEPELFSKIITTLYSVETSLCDQDEFLMNVSKAMRAKLAEQNLCGQEGSAFACGENSISASCVNQPVQDFRRKRQTTDSEVEIHVEVSGSSKDDINSLIGTIETSTREGLPLVVGDQTLTFVSLDISAQITVACQSGSISRQDACLICPLGTYHQSASNECRLCEAGTFQDETGQLQCKECGTGMYQNQTGQTSCNPCAVGTTSDGVKCSSVTSPQDDWVNIVIYACVGVGALLVIIIFILMVCLWQSTQEEKKQDQKRWELGNMTQLNKSYEPEEPEPQFRPRVNTTVSATTYQTVPEGDGTPNLGNGVTNTGYNLVRIPTEELYAGLTMDSRGNALTVGVENHHSPGNEFMSYGHDRHNFPV